MIGTLINDSNRKLYISAFPDDIMPFSDVLIGVYDEESDTACGVLSAEAIGRHILAIRHIYVHENWRRKGAGRELVNTLIRVVDEIKASVISCSHSRENSSDGIVELLESCGFARNEELTEPIFGIYLRDIKKPETLLAGKIEGLTFKSLSKIDKKTWQSQGYVWQSKGGSLNGEKAFSYSMDAFERDFSFVALDKNMDIVGMLLGVRSEKGYELKVLSAIGKYAPNILYALVNLAAEIGRMRLGEDTMVFCRPEQKDTLGLLEYISGGKYETVGETVQYTYEVLL